VTLQLTEDRGHREGREGRAPLRVEAGDRLDQPDARHLDQVVEGLGAAGVTSREPSGERHEPVDQLLADGRAAVLRVALEQSPLTRALLARPGRRGRSHLNVGQRNFVHRRDSSWPVALRPCGTRDESPTYVSYPA